MWGGTVLCRPLTLKEQAAHAETADGAEGQSESEASTRSMCAYLIRSLVDKNKQSIFKMEDLDALCEKNGAVIQTVFSQALKLNGVGKDAVEEAGKN